VQLAAYATNFPFKTTKFITQELGKISTEDNFAEKSISGGTLTKPVDPALSA